MTRASNYEQDSDRLSSDSDRYDLIRWRRDQVLTLRAKGYSIDKIVESLKAGHPDIKISHGTVVNDLRAIKEEVNKNLATYIQEELPFENKLCLSGIQEIIKEGWKLAESAEDDRTKIAALSLVKEAYLTQQALLGDSKILDQAVQWLKNARKQLEKPARASLAETSADEQSARFSRAEKEEEAA